MFNCKIIARRIRRVRDSEIQAILRRWYCIVGVLMNQFIEGILAILCKLKFTSVRQCRGNIVIVGRRCENMTMDIYCDGHKSIRTQIKNHGLYKTYHRRHLYPDVPLSMIAQFELNCRYYVRYLFDYLASSNVP